MRLTFRVPTEEEQNQANRFRTYLNYLNAISEFVGDVYNHPTDLLAPVVASEGFQRIQGGRIIDPDRMSELMRNAWLTETQISLASRFEAFVSYSNHWIPVQAYYAAYLALRAYFNATGQNVTREHGTNLKAISEEINRRPDLYPYPWKTLCIGNPEVRAGQYENLPPDVVVSQISGLTNSARVPFWDSYTKFLKTTRARHLEKMCEDWKESQSKKRVSSIAKRQMINNLSPTSLFHCLYRLRLRSNYSDADSFLLSVSGSVDATSFHQSLRKTIWATLLVLETLIARHVGKRHFESIVDGFRRYELQGLSDDLIGLRWGSVRTLW